MKGRFKETFLVTVVWLLCLGAYSQQAYFTSPTGLPTNAGTMARPWSLKYALDGAQAAGKIKAGDTIYLLAGTYKGNFVSNLGFATGLPIIVKNYNGQRAAIDGNAGAASETSALVVRGANTWFHGLEITSSAARRIGGGKSGTSYAQELIMCGGIEVFGKDIKIISCIVHDMPGTGISSWKYSDNNEVYGCMVYNNGIVNLADSNGTASERGNGPGFYIQHLNSAKPKIISNNFIFKNFSNGIQAKTVIDTPGHALNGINMDSNTIFNSCALNYPSIARKYNLYLGSEIYAANPAENIYVRGNVFYRDETDGAAPYINAGDGQWKPAWHRQNNISLGAGQADSFVHFRNNHVVGTSYAGSVYVRNTFGQFDFQHNTLYDPIGAGALVGVEYFSLYKPADTVRLKGNWNNNRYFSKSNEPFWRFTPFQNKDKTLSLQSFRTDMKVDAASIHQKNVLPPDTAFIRPNKYEKNTFFVTVLNHSRGNLYSLSFSNVQLKGLYYTVTDIQDYYGKQVTSGVYNGTGISLPMNLSAVSVPVGEVPLQPQHTSAGLGTFIIRFLAAAPNGLGCNPPTALVASNTNSANSIKLTWNVANEAVRYVVQKKNGTAWDSIGTTSANNFTVVNLLAYENYTFRVGTRCVGDTALRFSNEAKSPGRYFVAVNGTATSTGKFSAPWSLAYALSGAGGAIAAGDSIFLKAGVYKGNFTALNLAGTDERPVVFRNFDGGAAVIDGYVANNDLPALTIAPSCTNVYVMGLEVKSSSPSRMSAAAGDMYTGRGIFVQGHAVKIVNCIVHDMPGDGISLEKNASETEVYGCIVYNNGIERALAASGNGISVQNADAEVRKKITNSFIFKNNSTGVFVYGGTSSITVNGIDIDSSTIFNTGAMLTNTLARKYNILVGGSVSAYAARGINITNNVIYRDETDGAGTDKPHNLRYNINLGQSNVTDSSVSLQNNHIIGGGYYGAVYVQSNFLKYNVQHNIFYAPDANNKLLFIKTGVVLPPVWNSNRYYSANNGAFSGLTFDGWKTTYKVDGSGSYNAAKPADTFSVRRNKYEPDVYYVTVLNHSRAASFRLPLDNTAFAGRSVSVIDAQNYFDGPIVTGTFNGSYIDLPMTSTEAAAPVGTVATQPKHSSSNLGTFIIRLAEAPVHCPGSNTSFTSNIAGSSYQWQVNNGNGFTNVLNGANYTGANTATLQLINMSYSINNSQYRCMVGSLYSNIYRLRLAASTWVGTVSSAWENAANWACGIVPSSGSEVIISGGNVVLASHGFCGSITLKDNAVFTVKPGYTLTITQLKQ